ncbi:MAG: substrate-binding domain-containing protein [Saprospiraceae bacterium]|nr:substrate-binding domain-containing protein [Saprospiraceae bacterium]
MERRIRIKDIAEKAGVSTGTVDRVIHKRGNVSPKTKQKVKQVMEELGYEPNIIASMLAYNRVFKIAALLPDYHVDPYWQQPKIGIDKAIESIKHYGVEVIPFYFNLFKAEEFSQQANNILDQSKEFSGVLLAPLFLKEASELLKQCSEKHIPTAMINTNIENSESLCYIGQDSYQSGVLAGRLIDFGCDKVDTTLVLNLAKGVTNAKHLLDKERGFRDYFNSLPEKEITVLKKDFEDFTDDAKLSRFLKTIFEQHPKTTGIFVTNSRAYRIAKCLQLIGKKEVKIVGYDLLEENLQYLRSNDISFLINQNPVQQGYFGIMNLVNHLLLKKEIDPLQYLPLDIVVNENVEYYLKRALEFSIVV